MTLWDQKGPGAEEGCVAEVKSSHAQHHFFIPLAALGPHPAALLLDIRQAGVRLDGPTCAPSYPGSVPLPCSCHLPQSWVLHQKCINNFKAFFLEWSDLYQFYIYISSRIS